MKKRYKLSFIGRTKGAIGVFYPIVSWREALSPEEAHQMLYDEYEHIQQLKIEEIKNDPDTQHHNG